MSFTFPVWGWISTLLNTLYPNPVVLTPQLILFRYGLLPGNTSRWCYAVTDFLIEIALDELWAGRDLATFQSKQPGVFLGYSCGRSCSRSGSRVTGAYHGLRFIITIISL